MEMQKNNSDRRSHRKDSRLVCCSGTAGLQVLDSFIAGAGTKILEFALSTEAARKN